MYPGYMDLSKVTLFQKKIKDDPKEIQILLGWNSPCSCREMLKNRHCLSHP